jgi:hypothetical protein
METDGNSLNQNLKKNGVRRHVSGKHTYQSGMLALRKADQVKNIAGCSMLLAQGVWMLVALSQGVPTTSHSPNRDSDTLGHNMTHRIGWRHIALPVCRTIPCSTHQNAVG